MYFENTFMFNYFWTDSDYIFPTEAFGRVTETETICQDKKVTIGWV